MPGVSYERLDSKLEAPNILRKAPRQIHQAVSLTLPLLNS